MESMSELYTDADTCVFWDFVDFPVPEGGDLHSLYGNIVKALEVECYRGEVSLKAYGELKSAPQLYSFMSANIDIVHEAADKRQRHARMLGDMVYWALNQYRPASRKNSGFQANLMVIAKDFPEDEESVLVDVVKKLDGMKLDGMLFNILLVVPDDHEELPPTAATPKAKELLSVPLFVWRWGILFKGGPPIEVDDSDSESSQGEPAPQV